jgi:SAM-dependent methyltransferase
MILSGDINGRSGGVERTPIDTNWQTPTIPRSVRWSRMFDPAQTFNDDYLWFYEPMLTEERNRAEAAEIVDTLGLTAGASILDAPCGHGRIANLLASAGFKVTGVDLTQPFLDRARADAQRLGVEVESVQGDLRNLLVVRRGFSDVGRHRPDQRERVRDVCRHLTDAPLVPGPFDAVVCWFTSFGYFEDSDNRRVLEQFASVLRPGGMLLIETMHHDGFLRGFISAPAATLTERGDDVMSDVTTFNPVRGRIETERTVRRAGEIRRSSHSVRLPTVPEFDEWLGAAGFSTRSYHDRRGRALRFDSGRIVVTATR